MSNNASEQDEIVYHYCSNKTFLSIIQNKSIWLSDLMSSNDSMEGRWAIKKYLDKAEYESPQAASYVERFLEQRLAERYVLGCCFSKAGDLLSQWRGYAANGKGVCIGFHRKTLEKVILPNEGPAGAANLLEVGYCDKLPPTIKAKIDKIAGNAIRFLSQSGLVDLHIAPAPQEARDFSDLISGFATLKNPAFSEEQELRLLCVCEATYMPTVKFREANDILSPYVEVEISSEQISTVMLGPQNPTPRSYVYRLLDDHGFSGVQVQNSTASFIYR